MRALHCLFYPNKGGCVEKHMLDKPVFPIFADVVHH